MGGVIVAVGDGITFTETYPVSEQPKLLLATTVKVEEEVKVKETTEVVAPVFHE